MRLYHPPSSLRLPRLIDVEALHAQWEETVKTNLHNSLSVSHVVRFLDSNESVVYPNVAAGIPEKQQPRYVILYSQILQLYIFKDEIERDFSS